jgi:hypothetical protein
MSIEQLRSERDNLRKQQLDATEPQRIALREKLVGLKLKRRDHAAQGAAESELRSLDSEIAMLSAQRTTFLRSSEHNVVMQKLQQARRAERKKRLSPPEETQIEIEAASDEALERKQHLLTEALYHTTAAHKRELLAVAREKSKRALRTENRRLLARLSPEQRALLLEELQSA